MSTSTFCHQHRQIVSNFKPPTINMIILPWSWISFVSIEFWALMVWWNTRFEAPVIFDTSANTNLLKRIISKTFGVQILEFPPMPRVLTKSTKMSFRSVFSWTVQIRLWIFYMILFMTKESHKKIASIRLD